MPHLDDATIHTLLDKELDTAEQRAVDSHLAQCEQCAARVAEERSIVSGAEELIRSLDDSTSEPAEVRSEKGEVRTEKEEARSQAGEVRSEQGARAAFLHPSAEPKGKGPPVVLVPERVDSGPGRLRWPLAAAAMVIIAAGAAWLALRPSEPPAIAAGAENVAFDTISRAEADSISAAIMNSQAAAAPVATSEDDTSTDAAAAAEATAARVTRPLPADLAVGVTGGGSSTADAESARLRLEAAEVARIESTALAVRESLVASQRARDSLAQLAQRRAADSARQVLALRDAEEAARRDRAEVALQSPPAQRAARPSAGAAAPPREQVTSGQRDEPVMRLGPVGLDEAADLLGGPVHAIDGMRFTSLSLVAPSNFPGSDQSRPVVRATYVGVDGSTIYLDQQRMLDGSGEGDMEEVYRASGWYIGNVKLRLTGDVTYDSLAVLVGKVR